MSRFIKLKNTNLKVFVLVSLDKITCVNPSFIENNNSFNPTVYLEDGRLISIDEESYSKLTKLIAEYGII